MQCDHKPITWQTGLTLIEPFEFPAFLDRFMIDSLLPAIKSSKSTKRVQVQNCRHPRVAANRLLEADF